VPCDLVLVGTPIDSTRVVRVRQAVLHVTCSLDGSTGALREAVPGAVRGRVTAQTRESARPRVACRWRAARPSVGGAGTGGPRMNDPEPAAAKPSAAGPPAADRPPEPIPPRPPQADRRRRGVLDPRAVRFTSFCIIVLGLFATALLCVLAIWDYTSRDTAWRALSTPGVVALTMVIFTVINEMFGSRLEP